MNKYHHCRCALCDHINVPGEEPLVFPLPDMCIDCYVAVSSCFTAVEDEDMGGMGRDPPRERSLGSYCERRVWYGKKEGEQKEEVEG